VFFLCCGPERAKFSAPSKFKREMFYAGDPRNGALMIFFNVQKIYSCKNSGRFHGSLSVFAQLTLVFVYEDFMFVVRRYRSDILTVKCARIFLLL
jgi:hypothetical protein